VKPAVGATLGDRYVLSQELGERPGAVEYRAYDREIEVEVALWWIRPELVADPARTDAVVGAGVELRALHDLALRKCFGVGRGARRDDGVWATWQLASGAGLVPVSEPVALAQLRRWLDAVERGLGVLHARGLVHGRMTPLDVVTIGGSLKLGGGGLWRDVDPRAAMHAWAGFAHVLAPEVRRGETPSAAADTWSVAMIALELIAGVSGASPECARAAAQRHPQLAAVLSGALDRDPGGRPSIAALAEAARRASEYPYLDLVASAAPASDFDDEEGTRVGHVSPDAPTPRRSRVIAPPPGTSAAKQPAAAKPFVVQAISHKESSGPVALPRDLPAIPVSSPSQPVQPPPPPPAPMPDQPTGETPALPKPKLRSLADLQGGRAFSVAPGQLGYLAPPKPKPLSEPREHRRARLIVLALIAILAASAGVAAALLL